MHIEPITSLKNAEAILASRAFNEAVKAATRFVREIPIWRPEVTISATDDHHVRLEVTRLLLPWELTRIFDEVGARVKDDVSGIIQYANDRDVKETRLEMRMSAAAFMRAFTPAEYRGWDDRKKWYEKLGLDKIRWEKFRDLPASLAGCRPF